jgi:tetratricopeptide (TPR) repeat protein
LRPAPAEWLAPDLADVISARARIEYAQHNDKAIAIAQAVAQQPECGRPRRSWPPLSAGRYEEGAELADSALEIVSNDYNALVPLINSLEKVGRVADAERLRRREREVLENQLQRFPDDVRARILLASDQASAGETDSALMHVKIAVAMRPSDANVLYNAACTYGLLGMKIDALETFRRAVTAGYSNLDWCLKDPDLKILYDEPEFRTLIATHAKRSK